MRFPASVSSISWIPSEAMTGLMRLPMDLGIGHYDQPPPDRLESGDLEVLRDADRLRFANQLSAWIEVADGAIVDAGYNGTALVGSTTAKLGLSITVPGVGFPILQSNPVIENGEARFVQTAGGRTGAPLPRRIDRPPYVRMTAPTAWTTLGLRIRTDGTSAFELIGASPFPRHWIYGPDGEISAKSGIIDFEEWTLVHSHDRTPWHDYEREALMASVESQVERDLSKAVMSSKPKMLKVSEGDRLIIQGEPGSSIYLILDGMLQVDVDDTPVAELGPGAIVGERAILETGKATATVTAMTPVRAARLPAANLNRDDLEQVATHHRREETGD